MTRQSPTLRSEQSLSRCAPNFCRSGVLNRNFRSVRKRTRPTQQRIYIMRFSFRRRCRPTRNRIFAICVLFLTTGSLYILGYQSGSLSWAKEGVIHADHEDSDYPNLPVDERLQLVELDRQDNIVDVPDETSRETTTNDLIDEEHGLLTQEAATDNRSDDDQNSKNKRNRKSKTLDYKSTSNSITTISLTRMIKATSSLAQSSSITTARGRPQSLKTWKHESQKRSPYNISTHTKKRTTENGKISVKYSNISSKDRLRKDQSKLQTVSDAGKVTKISKGRPFSSSDKTLLEIPVNQSHSSGCPQNFLDQQTTWRYGKCVPHQATDKACQIANEYYQLDPSLTKCRNDLQRTICDVEVQPASSDISVQCNKSLCRENTRPDTILVLGLNTKDGFIKVSRKFQTVDQLEKHLPDVIKMNIKKNVYFLFIRCTLNGTKTKINQLVSIDPVLTIREMGDSKSRDSKRINVNILLLDSVSRAHFYRSLPKTIQVFKTWRKNPKNPPAQVFDFELFQAVEGHTAENTYAFFNGKLFSPEQRNKNQKSVNPGNMFGAFSRAGYQTMWQEDLCWTGGWGLMTDVGARKWSDIRKGIQDNHIHHTGITHSSCEILVSNGVNSPFMGPTGDQICYNGHFQHSYFLQYTLNTIRAITSNPTSLPLLSYMSLSVGHDHIGRRIQSLDPALVEYLNELSLNQDTLTVVLSDHGNTYTSYTSTLEGRFEMFHPHLFLIIPKRVAQRLGKEALEALRINQHRLVNIIDLHHSIMALSKPLDGAVSPVGLFTPISAQRTCDHFELRLPNMCVCEGWNAPASNDTLRIAFVEFAIGQLNNEIEEKRKNGRFERSCVRLSASRFGNVQERQDTSRGSLITSIDVFIPAGDVVEQDEDIFHVEIESYELPWQRSLNMKLVTFDRVTTYGKYAVCADQGVPLKLCICSKSKTPRKHFFPQFIPVQDTGFLGQQPLVKKISQCVFLLIRQHFKTRTSSAQPESFGFELVNTCFDVCFNLSVHSTTKNIKLSRDCPFMLLVPPYRTYFFLSAKKDISDWESTISVYIQIHSSMEMYSHTTQSPQKHLNVSRLTTLTHSLHPRSQLSLPPTLKD